MSKQSLIRADHIEYSLWLVFRSDGGARLTRTRPSLGRDERAVSMTATLPKSLFSTPDLKVTMKVADPASAAQPIDIDVAAEALVNALGVDIDIRVQP